MRTILVDQKAGTLRTGGRELLAERKSPGSWVWADLEKEDPDTERTLLTGEFGVHHLAVQDAQRDRHPAKFEAFEASTFLLLGGLSAETTDIDFETLQIALFFGDDFLVTRRVVESVSIDGTWLDIMQRLAHPGVPGVPAGSRHEFTDLYENTERLVSLSALYQELINDLIAGYISLSSHRLNQIMKVLTIVTLLLIFRHKKWL